MELKRRCVVISTEVIAAKLHITQPLVVIDDEHAVAKVVGVDLSL